VAATALVALPLSAAAAELLRPDGLGKVRLGMSLTQAERALGARLGPIEGTSASEPCWLAIRRDKRDAGIAYMIERGAITRIDLYRPRSGAAPAVTTAKGIGIGSTLDDIRRAYGDAVGIAPHPISPMARWALVERSRRAGIRMELIDGKVTSLWAGRGPALDYSEGCS
jgi:hypothetical protein